MTLLLCSFLLVLLHGCAGQAFFPTFDAAGLASSFQLVGTANLTGQRIRLTPPVAGAAGAAWLNAPQPFSAGFTVDFVVRATIDDPAQLLSPCRTTDQLPESCERKPGDGLALVLHTRGGAAALGLSGSGLGYAGLPGGLAVEMDAWHDAEVSDPGDNHLAVLSRGSKTLRPDHSTAIGSAALPLQLGDGRPHAVRVQFSPVLAPDTPGHPAFKASAHLATLVYPQAVPWQHPLGSLSVWIDPQNTAFGSSPEPLLIVPLNLDILLMNALPCPVSSPNVTASEQCDDGLAPPPAPPSPPPALADGQPALCCPDGTAWVGFTASTGAAMAAWEVLSFAFTIA
jgi:hypothetical protein